MYKKVESRKFLFEQADEVLVFKNILNIGFETINIIKNSK